MIKGFAITINSATPRLWVKVFMISLGMKMKNAFNKYMIANNLETKFEILYRCLI